MQLQGSLRFTDPDADVVDLEITVTPPTGASSTVKVAITGASGKTEADAAFVPAITAPQAGRHEVRVVLVDAEGHASAPNAVDVIAK